MKNMYIYTVMKVKKKKKIMKREVTGFAENNVLHQICVHVPLPASNTHQSTCIWSIYSRNTEDILISGF